MVKQANLNQQKFYKKGTRKMNNEPVAWYYENKNGVSWVSGTQEKHDKNFVAVEKPIYTHPAKTLTDEEIMLVSDEFKGLPVTSVEAWNKVILLFARAILRKASEK